MQTKFTAVAEKLTTIKSGLAEAISAKGVETAPNAPFSTMIDNIGSITGGESESKPEPLPEAEEWVKPHDWTDIEEEPLEAGEVRMLICDAFGKEGNVVRLYKRASSTKVQATVEWGDGTIDEVDATSSTIDLIHNYEEDGMPCDRGYTTYVVKIKIVNPSTAPSSISNYRSGATSTIHKYSNLLWIYGDMQYLTDVKYLTVHPTLYGFSVLMERANLLNTYNVTTFSYLFYNCYSVKSIPQLDTSKATSMLSTFCNSNSLQVIPPLNTSNVTSMNSMFYNCRSLLYIPEIDTSKATSFVSLFEGCSLIKSVPKLNTSKVTNMNKMFYNCSSLKSICELDTSNVTNMDYMFYGCSSLKEIPAMNTSKVTSMNWIFYGCGSLIKLPYLDTNKVTNGTYMFNGCSSLEEIPLIDTSNMKSVNCIFAKCISLKKVHALNTSNCTDFTSMFDGCYSLQNIPPFDTSNATKMTSIFDECTSLKETPPIDTRKATGSYTYNYNHFYGCTSLFKINTVILSKDIKLEVTTSAYKMPLKEVNVDYDRDNPPAFTQTTPIKINYTQMSAEALNKLMEQLPPGNGKTLDLKYNPGSTTCDPTIATAKNWTVLVK